MFNLVLVLISVRLDMSRVRRGHLCFGRCVAHAVDTIGYVDLKDPPPLDCKKHLLVQSHVEYTAFSDQK